LSELDLTEHGPADAGHARERLQREILLLAKAAQVLAHHRGQIGWHRAAFTEREVFAVDIARVLLRGRREARCRRLAVRDARCLPDRTPGAHASCPSSRTHGTTGRPL